MIRFLRKKRPSENEAWFSDGL
jgi:hypothetical protein